MESIGHKPVLQGTRYVCANCGDFLLDVRTSARLRVLEDVDPVKLDAVERRMLRDPKLAKRLVEEDLREVVATYKLADKFNDFLMNPKARPDLQSPEAQQFLDLLKTHYLNNKTDEMMPWIVREWKKGRARQSPDPRGERVQMDFGPDYSYTNPNGDEEHFHSVAPDVLNHWADWYRSDHPSRRGVDIMQLKSPELHQTIKDWDADMRDKAEGEAQVRGDVLHSYPDGWTVQRLTTPKQLEDEGEHMGHCVGAYAEPVRRGESLIYSLRDHHNEPHATWEIRPRLWENPDGSMVNGEDRNGIPAFAKPVPYQGRMEQIQGRGNQPPIPEYQERIRDYFEHTMPDPTERPTWEEQHYDDPGYLVDPDDGGYVAYHPGEYGLAKPDSTYDWPRIINYALGEAGGYNETPASDLTQKAVEHGQFEPFAAEAQRQIELGRAQHQEQVENEFRNWWEREGELYMDEGGLVHPDHSIWEDEDGNEDEKAYEKALEEYYKHRDEWEDQARREFEYERHNPQQDMHNYMDELEVEITAQRRREREADQAGVEPSEYESYRGTPPSQEVTGSVKGIPHTNFSTGEPCNCTFTRHLQQPFWHVATELICEACGDPLEHGKCKRCDWGGWSNAMGTENPSDPTQDLKPDITNAV